MSPQSDSVGNDSTDEGDFNKDTAHPPGTDESEEGHATDVHTDTESLHKMHKFTVYETSTQYYIVGSDVDEQRYRVLKIGRSTHDSGLVLTDDKMIYSPDEVKDVLDSWGKPSGGVKIRCLAWGLIGFVKFTGPYYMLLITKKSSVAMIGGHYIYQVEGTELIPLTPPRFKADVRNTEESRFLAILNNLDLTRSFYYSYSYDITRTLQHNVTKERVALLDSPSSPPEQSLNSMFVWNSHLLQPARSVLEDPFDWCRPIIHGYIDQASLSIYGRTAYITVIARRSRYFAGARFLKRGANDLGYVANDVETEQIVSDVLTTSFHAPGPKLFSSPQYTSYVQHRGSIPLHWSQDNTGVTPKPPIEINLVDPFYSAAALHFDDLFRRYGAPVYVLNLVKARERTPRESKLLGEFTTAINYLNQFLPGDKKIIHRAWDMSRAAKSRDQDVIGTLESIAEEVVMTTGFFHNGDGKATPTSVQNGVARTNCIDCLDRTNAAQFVIGKRALGHQLHALGILEDTSISYDTDAVNLFTHMYHDHGDTIAVQYGGSQLVNTMETYRKINQWTSHSRDMIESFKRYYNNSFLDGQRQEAYNLFLGNYIFSQGQPMLWDLPTDYYLHHADPRLWSTETKRDYRHWYSPTYLEKRTIPPYTQPSVSDATYPVLPPDDYWLEYYRPASLSSFLKMFPSRMNSTLKYIPLRSAQEGTYDWSPFRIRNDGETDPHDKKRGRKDVALLVPQEVDRLDDDETSSIMSEKTATAGRVISIQRWLQPLQEKPTAASEAPEGTALDAVRTKPTALDKSRAAQWTFKKVVHESLNPSVSQQEAADYVQYVSHPQSLPLVVSAEAPIDFGTEYQDYVHGIWQPDGQLNGLGTDEFSELLRVGDNPLTVTEEDAQKKRYKAYGKWLLGKSLFKQQPVD